MDRFEIEGLIGRVNLHNRWCSNVFEIVYDKVVDEEAFEKRIRENLEVGIELCCEMRSAGLDAYVDRLCGAVVNGRQVDLTEEIEGEGLRYFCFEWASEHEEA